MRNLIMSIFAAVLGICCLCIVCAISGRNARQMELNANLGNAVESTVAAAKTQGESLTHREFLADAVESMIGSLRTESSVEIRIWGAEEEKGMLGMEVVEMFQYPNGKKGKTAYSRTVIFDHKKESDGPYTVKFYRNKADMQSNAECYKTFVVEAGEKLKEPVRPALEDREFEGWRDINDYIADFSQTVEEDIVYYGAWSE